MKLKRLKRIKVYEEYVLLTGSFEKAVVLGQMIYWSERIKDFDAFIAEENERRKQNNKEPIELQHGWIYKSAEQLNEETMLHKTPNTIRNYLREFVRKGWLSERNNPVHKWDRTKQYRVNLNKIAEDLNALGLALPGYRVEFPTEKISDREENISDQSCENCGAISNTISGIKTCLKDNIRDFPSGKSRAYSFEEYLSSINRDSDIEEEKIEVVRYYLEKYREERGREHPKLRADQWEKVLDSIFKAEDDYGREFSLLPEHLFEMIDRYFETRYQEGCDYSILHFISPGVMMRRAFEVAAGP